MCADKLQAPEVHGFFDNDSNTVSYLVVDPAMKRRPLSILCLILIMRPAP